MATRTLAKFLLNNTGVRVNLANNVRLFSSTVPVPANYGKENNNKFWGVKKNLKQTLIFVVELYL